ncbi:hypothetical protein [Nocardioides acrostichi]|uniref:DUF3558 domain-containing protein n=1 Tax=Nocardioides acrostichi TaxID=2784339 RepID=A0A930V218_9ACTN|nr:hypothetical protein [Nocardioides acrostichi]MBF4162332.1 hypothetical protein [Nocardioides acrostichi]
MPPRRVPLLVLALVCVGVLALAGCSSDEQPPADVGPATPSASPLPSLGDIDTLRTSVARASFCGTVDGRALVKALGKRPRKATSYDNGDQTVLAPGLKDVAHEFSCTWSLGRQKMARAWVFAPPVTRGQAEADRALLRKTAGCEPLPKAPRFGASTVTLTCENAGTHRILRAGLFGDAWLTCALTLPDSVKAADLERRSETWCAAALQAASPSASPTASPTESASATS